MTDLEQSQSRGTSRVSCLFTRRWLVAVTCLVALAAIALLPLLWRRPSADAQLQAIDAAHAVPDEQNAAKDYMLLVQNEAGALLDPQLLAEDIRKATLARPWRSADSPLAAKWVEDRRAIMDALLQAGRKPKCWFPLSEPDRQSGKRFRRRLPFLAPVPALARQCEVLTRR